MDKLKMKLFLKHSYLIVLLVNFFPSIAQDTIKIDEEIYSHEALTISQYYYFDTSSVLNIEMINKFDFRYNREVKLYIENDPKNRVSFGNIDKDTSKKHQSISLKEAAKGVWLKFIINNITNHQINYLIQDTLVYYLSGNKVIYLNTRLEKKEQAFIGSAARGSITVSPHDTKTIFIFRKRVKNWQNVEFAQVVERNVINLTLNKRENILGNQVNSKIVFSVIFGAIIILLLYNLFVCVLLKRKIYLYYFLYIFFVFIPFIDEDIMHLIMKKNLLETIFVAEYLIPIAFGFYALFILEYFRESGIKFIRFIRFYYTFIFTSVLIVLSIDIIELLTEVKIDIIWDLDFIIILTCFLLTFLAYILIIINSFILLKKKYKPAIYILIGNLIVLISFALTIYFSSQVNYWDTLFLEYSLVFGIFSEALIFSIGITDQINTLQKEVEKEQKTSIETLENKVEERTIQLKQEKEKVEFQKQEILDSIEYAKRIQTAILPPPRIVKEFLKNSFVLYLPKDIVAGDFYWMESMDDKIYFAACDCTGHGVPGAMVSVVCNNALNRALNEFGERDPAKLFDKTRELVLENFAKSDEEVQDGMDASLAVLNVETKEMLWSGANNPLWIYRTKSNFIEEIKADKQPIGKGYENKPFTTHKVDLNEGDIIYLFTDGYSDQFGGDKGRKLTKSKFKDLLLKIANLPMEKQREELLSFHDKYRGIEEQVDDICIIGVRV